MSTRRKKLQSIGASFDINGRRSDFLCDGTNHWFTPHGRPRERKPAGKCNCREFFEAVMRICTL